jgi:hypothetical protein
MMRKVLVIGLIMAAALFAQTSYAQSSVFLESGQSDVGMGLFYQEELVQVVPYDMGHDYVLVDNNNSDTFDGKIKTATPDETSAVRYTVGVRLPWAGLDILARCFEWETDGYDAFQAKAGQTLRAIQRHSDGTAVIDTNANFAIGEMELYFKTLDIEFGQKVRLTENLNARFYIGGQWLEVERNLISNYRIIASTTSTLVREDLEIEGFGVKTGTEMEYTIIGGLAVDGGLNISAIGCKYDWRRSEVDNNPTSLNVLIDKETRQIVPMINVKAGVSYGHTFGETMTVTAGIGYEYTTLFGLFSQQFVDDVHESANATEYEHLSFHGMTGRVRIDF